MRAHVRGHRSVPNIPGRIGGCHASCQRRPSHHHSVGRHASRISERLGQGLVLGLFAMASAAYDPAPADPFEERSTATRGCVAAPESVPHELAQPSGTLWLPIPDRWPASKETTVTFEAFWIPGLDDDIDIDDSLDLGFQWMEDWERSHGGTGLLVMYAVSSARSDPRIAEATRRWDVISRRSRGYGRGKGPVLCIWPPDDATLELAESRAMNTALCVIPGSLMDIGPWIEKTRARCLVEGFERQVMAPLPPEIARILDGMLFFGGHNTFLGSGEKERAIRDLRRIAERADAPSREALEDYLRASGETRGEGARRVGEWYDGVRHGRSYRDYRGRPL